jgi:hypothetical protein
VGGSKKEDETEGEVGREKKGRGLAEREREKENRSGRGGYLGQV